MPNRIPRHYTVLILTASLNNQLNKISQLVTGKREVQYQMSYFIRTSHVSRQVAPPPAIPQNYCNWRGMNALFHERTCSFLVSSFLYSSSPRAMGMYLPFFAYSILVYIFFCNMKSMDDRTKFIIPSAERACYVYKCLKCKCTIKIVFKKYNNLLFQIQYNGQICKGRKTKRHLLQLLPILYNTSKSVRSWFVKLWVATYSKRDRRVLKNYLKHSVSTHS
jgi:hypothetical protein